MFTAVMHAFSLHGTAFPPSLPVFPRIEIKLVYIIVSN
jgi:hypothetical protein